MPGLGKRLVFFAAVLASAVLVVAVVFTVGFASLERMLARDALLTAQLWHKSIASQFEPADPAPGFRSPNLLDTLRIAEIDAVLNLRGDGRAVPLGPTAPESVADFQAVAEQARADGTEPSPGAPAVALSDDDISWLTEPRYRTWVVLPDTGSGDRLAVRIQQSRDAALLRTSFQRELIYSGGVAAITFFSFMAGFTYRARQLMKENEAIRFLTLHDELTGLPNRKKFEAFGIKALAQDREAAAMTAVFLLDLDGFKAINDTLGHPIGDGLLKAAAKRLKGSLREDDLLARLSGDEFAVIVPKVAQTSQLAPIAERILKLLSAPFRIDGHEVLIGCSIGVAVAPDNGTDLETLIRNADFALYRAKSEGKRTWRFFDPKMAADLAARRMLEAGLRDALARGSFEIAYQPQVRLATGAIVGYEAMLRWRLPDGTLAPASNFVSVAEDTGLVVPIGEWVIDRVAQDCSRMLPTRRISINLSAAQLKREGIDLFLRDRFARHGIAPGRIDIEVNEGILGRNEAISVERLRRIRAAGMKIVMESFGVGTLSLGLLSRYPFDKIKLDRSFLNNMRDDRQSAAVLAAICGLCRSLGMEVAGSGVETREQSEILLAAGCSEGQGFHFARPMSIEELVAAEAAEHAGTGVPNLRAVG